MKLLVFLALLTLISVQAIPFSARRASASQPGASQDNSLSPSPRRSWLPASRSTDSSAKLAPAEQAGYAGAKLGTEVTVQAEGRGKPFVNLGNGHEIITSFEGGNSLINSMESGQARPLSLTSADLDQDGVPDLITGLATPGGGVIAVNRGNVDAIYPYSKAARVRRNNGTFSDAPFLSPTRLFELPAAPDFIESGDFNGDGYADVAVASRGGDAIFLLPGDGSGQLGVPKVIKVDGRITTMTSGDVNRRDGLPDLIVGIGGNKGPELLVFEGPSGALNTAPEAISLPAEAAGAGVAHFFNSTFTDIAVAAGRFLVVVHGRDRQLSLPSGGASLGPAVVSTLALPATATAIATGKFYGLQNAQAAIMLENGKVELAGTRGTWTEQIRKLELVPMSSDVAGVNPRLVRAHVSGAQGDDLVVVDPVGSRLRVLLGKKSQDAAETLLGSNTPVDLDADVSPVAVLPMRLNPSARNDLMVLRKGSVNASVVPAEFDNTFTVTTTADDFDQIQAAPAAEPNTTLRDTIVEAVNAPAGTNNEIIFAIAATGIPEITLQGPLPALGANNSLTVSGFSEEQSSRSGAAMVEVDGNGNNVFVSPGSSDVIGGMVINDASVAIELTGGKDNIVEGNFIGTDIDGVTPIPNTGSGVMLNGSSDSMIGGTSTESPNVIGGNKGDGITLTNGAASNTVIGNFVGTDAATHSSSVANGGNGITIANGATGTTVGSPSAFNFFSFNSGHGLDISSGSNHLIQDNGVQGNGGQGLLLAGASTSTVGGSQNANVANGFWDNKQSGVLIESGSTAIMIQGNGMGIAFSNGVPVPLPNGLDGVSISGSTNLVGGATTDLGNNIAFNGADGVAVLSGAGNGILSNVIAANSPGLAIHLFPGTNDNAQPPVITQAVVSSSAPPSAPSVTVRSATVIPSASAPVMVISFAFNSTPNQTFNMQFYVPEICNCTNCFTTVGIYSKQITTDSSGNAPSPVSITLSAQPASGSFVNATATDTADDTSEFSECVQVGTASACTYTLSAGSQEFSSSGGSGSFTVTTQSTCPFLPQDSDSWVHITSPGGTGDGTVTFTVDPNTGTTSRTSTITVATGVDFTITEDGPGPDFSLQLSSQTVSGAPGSVTPVTVSITRTGGFTGAIVVTPPAKADGIKIKPATTVKLKGANTSFSVNVKITATAVAGTYPFTFSATGAGLTGSQSAVLSVTVQ